MMQSARSEGERWRRCGCMRARARVHRAVGGLQMRGRPRRVNRSQELLGHLAPWPCLILVSGADECVPAALAPRIPAMAARLAAAMGPRARGCVIEGASHACAGHEVEVAALLEEFFVTV